MPFDTPLSNALAQAMAEPINETAHTSFYGQSTVPAGMTYLGQFIAHDIVTPTNPNLRSRNVTPKLNLDSIYGDAPLYLLNSAPQTTGILNSRGEFEFTDIGDHLEADFCRDIRQEKDLNGDVLKEHYIANIPEQRNDENIIVAQFHMLWQKLHNKLLKSYALDPLQAREMVTLLFQCVVVEEFLHHILSKDVYQCSFTHNQDLFKWSGDTLPDFFTKASYRFGHSIVRRSYKLQDGQPGVNIGDLFRRGKKLKPQHIIDWHKFFSLTQQHTGRFDTKITSPMTNIPAFHAPNIASHIAAKNLLAGELAGLPTGLEITRSVMDQNEGLAERLGVTPLTDLKGASFEGLTGLEIDNLPLWPYLLLEAQQISHGVCLGPVGSILNAEVLKWSIKHSEFSIYMDGVYNFATVMESLGQLGQHLVSLRGEYSQPDSPKLNMMTIIEFLHQ